jgi:transcriptional regulator with XRE-family HTH domain
MSLIEVFAANVQRYREAAGISQEVLAERAGISRPYTGTIERGQGNATLKVVEQVSQALGVDPAILLLNDILRPKASAHGKKTRPDSLEYEYALVHWADDGISIRPLDVRYNDLTVQVLLDLIARGYSGDTLIKAYQNASSEINRFFQETRG